MDKPNREKLIGELMKGRDLTTQLQILLQNPYEDHGSFSADEIVVKILRSFTETLSVLSYWESGEVFPIPATTQVGSPSCGDRRSEYSGKSSKRLTTLKDRRGCYKRRKTSNSWTVVSSNLEDNYAWRKYGQKDIFNTNYPRCYYRCTHKSNQGCKATKQVQRMEEEDSITMYQTTYFEQHTCTDFLKTQMIPNKDPDDLCLISFESKIQSCEQDHHHPVLKEEVKEETQSELSDNKSSLDSIVWPDLMAMESHEDSKLGLEIEDVISNLYTCGSTRFQGTDMDFLGGSVDFENDFPFDGNDFL